MKAEADLRRTAVMLSAFGGPRSLNEVVPFLKRLMGKRPSPQQIEDLQRRYQAIGNASPLPETTLRQARALEAELKRRGKPLPVFVGMRYSQPLIAEALKEIDKKEITRLILISLSPYRSAYTSEGYYAEVKRIIAARHTEVALVPIDGWHAHPALCAAWAKRIEDTLGRTAKREEIPVIFTAHSLPLAYATGSPYVRQLEETIEGIIRITGPVHWHLAFQSRAGEREKWLGPDPEKILEELSQEGRRKVLICPIGFIVDHLETLYDLDVALRGWATEQGIEVIRTPCLNDAPDLIGLLAHLVEGALPKQ